MKKPKDSPSPLKLYSDLAGEVSAVPPHTPWVPPSQIWASQNEAKPQALSQLVYGQGLVLIFILYRADKAFFLCMLVISNGGYDAKRLKCTLPKIVPLKTAFY